MAHSNFDYQRFFRLSIQITCRKLAVYKLPVESNEKEVRIWDYGVEIVLVVGRVLSSSQGLGILNRCVVKIVISS